MDRYQFNILKKRDAGIPLSPMEKYVLYKDLDPYTSWQLQKYDMMRQIENRDKIVIDKKELDALIQKAAAEIANDVNNSLKSIDIGHRS